MDEYNSQMKIKTRELLDKVLTLEPNDAYTSALYYNVASTRVRLSTLNNNVYMYLSNDPLPILVVSDKERDEITKKIEYYTYKKQSDTLDKVLSELNYNETQL